MVSTSLAKSLSGVMSSYRLSITSSRARSMSTPASPSSHRRKSGFTSSMWPHSRRSWAQKAWTVEIWAL